MMREGRFETGAGTHAEKFIMVRLKRLSYNVPNKEIEEIIEITPICHAVMKVSEKKFFCVLLQNTCRE